jgi:hypothetical protein
MTGRGLPARSGRGHAAMPSRIEAPAFFLPRPYHGFMNVLQTRPDVDSAIAETSNRYTNTNSNGRRSFS